MDETERVERRLKLHELRVLMSVVERGSMAKAAQRLATSQPAVSRAVKDLEHSLGVRLLDRSPRGIVPTPYGEALIRRGIAIFDELKQGVKDIEFLSDPTAGEIRIAAPIGQATGFGVAVIDRLARRYPRIVCHLMVADSPTPFHALVDRDVDLVIARMAEPIAEDHLEVEVLLADSVFVVARTTNPWLRRRKVSLADLMNEPWTMPPLGHPGRSLAASFFQAAGLELPRATVITSSGAARLALVAKGRFLTMASESVLRFAGWDRAIKALPIDLGASPGSIGIVTLKDRTLTPVAQLFIDCAREMAKTLSAVKSTRRQQARKT